QPLGRAGRRKLKKLFQEYGVPSWRRRQTPLLFYGDKLAAVAGLFVVEGFEGNECELVWKCDHLH
ncbi:tRNA lysidine(34) synthetase TilS, partial [Halomonas sp. SIMBA_159]